MHLRVFGEKKSFHFFRDLLLILNGPRRALTLWYVQRELCLHLVLYESHVKIELANADPDIR